MLSQRKKLLISTFFFIIILITTGFTKTETVDDAFHYARVAGIGPSPDDTSDSEIINMINDLKSQNVNVVDFDVQINDVYEIFLHPDKRIKFLKKMVKQAHKDDMKVFTYLAAFEILTHNATANSGKYIKEHTLYRDHPDWLQQDVNGRIAKFDYKSAFWIEKGDEDVWISPLATEWREHLMNTLEKIAATGVDAIYFDVPYWMTHFDGWEETWASFDKYTVAEFKKRYGIDPFKDFDVNNADAVYDSLKFKYWIEFRYDVIQEFLQEAKERTVKINPKIKLMIEEYPANSPDTAYLGVDPYRDSYFVDSIAHEYDPLDTVAFTRNPYDWIHFNAGISTLRSLDHWHPTIILTYNYNSDIPSSLIKDETEISKTLAWSTVSATGHFWETGGEDMVDTSAGYGYRKKVFAWIKKNEKLLYDRDFINPIGVYFSPDSRDYGDWGWYESFMADFTGTVDMLREMNYEYKVITPIDLKTISKDKLSVLIVPNAVCLSDDEIQEMKNYMDKGGFLVVTGISGIYNKYGVNYKSLGKPYPFAKLLGISYSGTADEQNYPQIDLKQGKNFLYTKNVFGKDYFYKALVNADGDPTHMSYPNDATEKIKKEFQKTIIKNIPYKNYYSVKSPGIVIVQSGKLAKGQYAFYINNYTGVQYMVNQVPKKTNVDITIYTNKVKKSVYYEFMGKKSKPKYDVKKGKIIVHLKNIERGGILVY